MSGMDRLTDEALVLIIDQLSRGNHRASLIEDAERAARELLAHRRASQAAPAPSDHTISKEWAESMMALDEGVTPSAGAPAPSDGLREAKLHIDAICIGLASPIHGEDPYGWLERAQAAQQALAAALTPAPAQEVKP